MQENMDELWCLTYSASASTEGYTYVPCQFFQMCSQPWHSIYKTDVDASVITLLIRYS